MSAFKRRRAEFETPHCPSCDSTNVVTDNRQGHLVCDDCGVILESSMISTATEYRNFSESDKPTGTLNTATFARKGGSRDKHKDVILSLSAFWMQ